MIKHGENLRPHSWYIVVIDIMVLFLLSLIYLWPLVVGSQEEMVWGEDYYLQYFSPVFESFVRTYREEGVLSYRILFGPAPYVANMEMPVFSPLTLFLLLMPSAVLSVRGMMIFTVLAAGLSMYVLMVVWKSNRPAALLASVGYMLSGAVAARIRFGNLSLLWGYSWAPLALAFLVLALKKSRLSLAALAGLVLALQIQSGGFILSVYTAMLLAMYTGYWSLVNVLSLRSPSCADATKVIWMALRALVYAAIFAFALGAAKILPVWEASQFTDRQVGGLSFWDAFGGGYNNIWWIWRSLVSKHGMLFSAPWAGDWFSTYSPDYSHYIGAFLMGLALVSAAIVTALVLACFWRLLDDEAALVMIFLLLITV